jgi:hypothetical protein
MPYSAALRFAAALTKLRSSVSVAENSSTVGGRLAPLQKGVPELVMLLYCAVLVVV